jgi:hypothetical protein
MSGLLDRVNEKRASRESQDAEHQQRLATAAAERARQREIAEANVREFLTLVRDEPTLPLYVREITRERDPGNLDIPYKTLDVAYPCLGKGWLVQEHALPAEGPSKVGLFVSQTGLVRQCLRIADVPPRDAPEGAVADRHVMAAYYIDHLAGETRIIGGRGPDEAIMELTGDPGAAILADALERYGIKAGVQ